MSAERRAPPKLCIYPGCQRPAVPPHPLGGPQPSFCDLEQHNALSAHLERHRLAREGGDAGQPEGARGSKEGEPHEREQSP